MSLFPPFFLGARRESSSRYGKPAASDRLFPERLSMNTCTPCPIQGFNCPNKKSIILSTKKSQLKFTEELNGKLRLDLKKQKLKNKILGGTGLIAIGGVILILK